MDPDPREFVMDFPISSPPPAFPISSPPPMAFPLPEPPTRPNTPESLADPNEVLAGWCMTLPDRWRERKCVLFGICFVFMFYPTVILATLICGDTCMSSDNYDFYYLLIGMIWMLHMIQCFFSLLCMRAAFYDTVT